MGKSFRPRGGRLVMQQNKRAATSYLKWKQRQNTENSTNCCFSFSTKVQRCVFLYKICLKVVEVSYSISRSAFAKKK